MPKFARLTVDQIQRARTAAEAFAEGFHAYAVNWTLTNKDKRAGTVHAWNAQREYLGQFRSHDAALSHGAQVTRLGYTWFLWS